MTVTQKLFKILSEHGFCINDDDVANGQTDDLIVFVLFNSQLCTFVYK